MADNKYSIVDFDQDDNDLLDDFSIVPYNEEVAQDVEIYDIPHQLNTPTNLDRYILELREYGDYPTGEGEVIQKLEISVNDMDMITYEDGYLKVDTLGLMGKYFQVLDGKYVVRISGIRNYIYKGSEFVLDEDGKPTDEQLTGLPFRDLTVVEKSNSGLELRVKAGEQTYRSFEKFYKTQTPSTMPDNEVSDDDEVVWPLNIRFTGLSDGFGNSRTTTSHNWVYHSHRVKSNDSQDYESIDTVILKFLTPVPSMVIPGSRIGVRRNLFIPFDVPVDINIKPII